MSSQEVIDTINPSRYITIHKRILLVCVVGVFVAGVFVGSKATSAYFYRLAHKREKLRREADAIDERLGKMVRPSPQ